MTCLCLEDDDDYVPYVPIKQSREAKFLKWRPPRHILEAPQREYDAIREKHHILVDGEKIPPPIKHFKFPPAILKYLKSKGINRPTLIQVQDLPVVLSGLDMIGIALTRSGKTLAFSIPLIMFALEEEVKLPLIRGEGLIGIIRELGRQTYESICVMNEFLILDGYPKLRILLCIGGMSMADQWNTLSDGIHIVVATPACNLAIGYEISTGDIEIFKSKGIKTIQVQGLPVILCLDEVDRMNDMGFEDDVKNIMSYHACNLAIGYEITTGDIEIFKSKGIKPIQVQGLPVRELARQTYESICVMNEFLVLDGYPKLRILLCIGGMSMADQWNKLSDGIHIVVATPGRLMDILEKGNLN
ncbi:P-loop containing nucleoside triphosphate hydrolase protein [Gigaspora rosea]|uniref:P-loop containing nucleoside triphosphate hydrolase protein n=1 Tax=Gigaspora rosea TaxID=44941 RepID=A0A397VLT5_9GLOM|nr:P-loop containing nucleoside triphosphate hydrolase protein [Gigaspora rosea]